MCSTWSVPDVCHTDCGGVVVLTANKTIEFASVEVRSVHCGGCVRGRRGGDSGSVVESRHYVHAEG